MNRLLRTVSTVAAGSGGHRGELRGAARSGPGNDIVGESGRPGVHGGPPRDVVVAAAAARGRRTGRPEPPGTRDRRRPAAPGRQAGLLPRRAAGAGRRRAAGGRRFPLPRPSWPPPAYGFAGFVALMAASVLLVIAAGELLLQHNYGSPDAPRSWPRQPVSPALLTTAVLALLVFLLVLVLTAAGKARLGRRPGLGAGRAAHGRRVRCVPPGGRHGAAPPGYSRCPRRPGRGAARHHRPPGGADPRGHPHRPGRRPAADPEQRLGGGAGPVCVRGDRPGRNILVAGDRGRSRPRGGGHRHRGHPGARPGPAGRGSAPLPRQEVSA